MTWMCDEQGRLRDDLVKPLCESSRRDRVYLPPSQCILAWLPQRGGVTGCVARAVPVVGAVCPERDQHVRRSGQIETRV